MFAAKGSSLPQSETLEISFLWKVLALLADIRLGLKTLSGANSLAYFDDLSLVTKKKSFTTLPPGPVLVPDL
jgi:hypothetical protein